MEDKIGNIREVKMKTQHLINGMIVNDTGVIFNFPTELQEQGKKIIQEWVISFPKEKTFVQREFGIPSLIVRLDCVVDSNERLFIYEVEDEPGGIGISNVINQQFNGLLKRCERDENWPTFAVIISPDWKNSDDFLWNKVIESEAWILPQKVWVKAHPHDVRFHHLEEYSVTTLKRKGDKSYGERMGLWKSIKIKDFEFLPWSEGFVLKPLVGYGAHNLEIWVGEGQKKLWGASTKSRIQKRLEEQKEMFVQKFVFPVNQGLPEFSILRPFFAYSPTCNDWICLGGYWVSRQNIRVHGSTDALCGPLVLE